MADNKQKKPKMDKRKILVSVMAAVMALLLILPMISMVFSFADATTASDIKQQIAALKKKDADLAAQKKNLKADLAAIKDDKEAAVNKKVVLEQQVDVITSEISNLREQIAGYDTLIAEKAAEVTAAQAVEEQQFQLFCQRTRAMEEQGKISYLATIFSSKSFSDLLDQVNCVSEIMAYDNAVRDNLIATRESLQVARTDLETAQKELQDAKSVQESAKAELKTKEANLASTIATISDKEYETEAAIKKLNAAAAEMDAAIAKEERALQALLSAGSGSIKFDPGSGYQWPLPSSYLSVTSFFGPRTHPITGRYNNHTGTDIAAPGGTSIYAAHGGIVLTSAYNGSYGNYVVVSRGDGVSTLYAHMSRRGVEKGQVVAQGQTIGYVGTTGSSTGNHLHFELRVDGVRTDALKYYKGIPWRNKTGFNY
ncbi:MAG: peptidoglycan DD-metalloendopeptidase family protein [Oscillospiraceae bacterium]